MALKLASIALIVCTIAIYETNAALHVNFFKYSHRPIHRVKRAELTPLENDVLNLTEQFADMIEKDNELFSFASRGKRVAKPDHAIKSTEQSTEGSGVGSTLEANGPSTVVMPEDDVVYETETTESIKEANELRRVVKEADAKKDEKGADDNKDKKSEKAADGKENEKEKPVEKQKKILPNKGKKALDESASSDVQQIAVTPMTVSLVLFATLLQLSTSLVLI